MRQLFVALMTIAAMAVAAAPAPAQQKAAKPAKSDKAAPTASAPLNLNTATVAQLETLPGVGTRTAQMIVEHRQKNGGFKKVEELMTIRGIGEKSFLKIKPLVVVEADKGDRAGDKR